VAAAPPRLLLLLLLFLSLSFLNIYICQYMHYIDVWDQNARFSYHGNLNTQLIKGVYNVQNILPMYHVLCITFCCHKWRPEQYGADI
jgi:hypothetical protein